jgi:hypothetical protein
MAEVVLRPENPKSSSLEDPHSDSVPMEEAYEYSEPPRSTIIPLTSAPTLKSLSGETLDASLIQSDYPRLTVQSTYEYSDPPRDTIINPEPISLSEPVTNLKNPPIIESVQSNKTLIIEDHTDLSFKERMKAKKIPEQLNIHSFILMLVGSQNMFLMGSLVFVKIAIELNITSIQEFLVLIWWAPYAAIAVYAGVYLLLWRFQRRISISASSFFLIQVGIGCESIFLIYANMVIGIELSYLFCASFQLISCVYVAALTAQCMKSSYTGIVGRLIAMGPCLVCMALYIAFAEGTWNIIAYVFDN